jgi:pimeloyl-ACP methyl ester carboxylesterase
MSLDAFNAHRSLIQTPEADLSYVDVGAGTPAVFVHGVGTNAHLWRNVVAAVASDQRRAIAFDLPVHGNSPARPEQDLSMGGLADTIADFVDGLDLPKFDLVAHDTGGALAQIYAARHPDRLRSFTLTNCDTHDNVPPEAFKPTVELAKAGALAPTAAALFADLATARTVVFGMGYEDPEYLSIDMVRCFLEPVIGTPEAALQFERMLSRLEPTDLLAAEPALARLDVPTLIAWGTGDEFFDVKWAYWLRDTIAGATEVVEVPGAKLFWPDERARDLVPHLLRHWDAADRVAAR